ncbi:glycine cleavage system aminomethyltransferase GcvT [Termitidicoccus mucosus]|uniref:Aminomethyltransferase n=1 Tax=Termitidicoccus mucosus TaxID=1184151 RepID=A0A178IQF4_9BACT|nr:glycine cleavage system protein T [Opitutaceae bacterium TSB47]
MSILKRTPLFDFHVAHGGRMVDFAGWEMPVQYRSILDEHKAVRRAAGLFDVSHMGEVDVRGPGALAFLQSLVTNDLAKMTPGRVVYSPMCGETGGVIDDLLVHMRAPGDYFLCINAGNIDKDLAWLRERRAAAPGLDVTLADRSGDTALIAIQGPRAAGIVRSLASGPAVAAALDDLNYYHFATGLTIAGIPCSAVARTGYTGEDGFELYHRPEDAPRFAEALLAAGAPLGLELAGLGARDSLRLEAGFPLHGHEISGDISPLAAGLAWTVKFAKNSDFCGRAALEREARDGSARRVVFFKTGDRRIVRAGAAVIDEAGAPLGTVLSGTLSPILNEAIGSALIDTTALAAGRALLTDIRGAKIALHPVKPPFVALKK